MSHLPIRETLQQLSDQVRKLALVEPQFPEAYCDVASFFLYDFLAKKGVRSELVSCVVEQRGHTLIRLQGEILVDFTAHQFLSLREYTDDEYGYPLIAGPREELEELGYTRVHVLTEKEKVRVYSDALPTLCKLLERYQEKIVERSQK